MNRAPLRVVGCCFLAFGACTAKTSGNPGTGGNGANGGSGPIPGSGGSGGSSGNAGAVGSSGGAIGSSGGAIGSGGMADGGATGGAAGTAVVDAGPVDVPRQDAAIACNAPPMATPAPSIAGTWTFTPAGAAATQIQVPGGGWFKQGFNIASATYATRITVPALLPAGTPQTTLIEFGAVNHEAALSVDGMLVATNMTAFTPSVFDVTKFVTPGASHAISVVVRGRNAFTVGGKTVPDGANWSPNIAQGIFRSATVRVYPDVYVSDVFVRTSVASGTITYDVSVTNTSTRSRPLTLSGTLDSWNCDSISYPALPGASVTVAAGQTAKVTVGPVPWGLGPETYWWPNVPYQATYNARLHNLRVALQENGAVVHERLTRFGFREITQTRADAQNVYYFLNGVRVNVRGDSLNGMDYDSITTGPGPGDAFDTLPGFMPPSAGNGGWPQAVRNYQRLNYNVLRIHQEPGAPYTLDIADELGMMIIDETAIRGPSDQNFILGHDNMVNHARALVLRDRNHPSIIRWSQANEPNINATDSVQFERDLYAAITALDPTRPVSIDVSGPGTVYDAIVLPNFSVFGHYYMGLGVYTDEVGARPDRPYGQGEFVWPNDVTRQGMMWFATSTAAMRAKNASDIRPYTLLSGWAGVIPGTTTQMMRLEPTYPQGIINPPLFGEDNLPDPWSNPILMRQQRAFNPVLVADLPYWELNKMSNANGDWPVTLPALARNVDVARTLTIFNDTFSGTSISVVWEVHADSPTGAMSSTGTFAVNVPPPPPPPTRFKTPPGGGEPGLSPAPRKERGAPFFKTPPPLPPPPPRPRGGPKSLPAAPLFRGGTRRGGRTPEAEATTGISIFMLSRTSRRSPAATRAPGSTRICQTLLVTSARTATSPGARTMSASAASLPVPPAPASSSGGGGIDAQRSRSASNAVCWRCLNASIDAWFSRRNPR